MIAIFPGLLIAMSDNSDNESEASLPTFRPFTRSISHGDHLDDSDDLDEDQYLDHGDDLDHG